MDITLIALIGLLIVLIILSLALASIVGAYNVLFSKLEDSRKKQRKSGREFKKTEELLDEEKDLLQQKLSEVISSESGEFQKVLATLKTEAMAVMSGVAQTAKSETRNDLIDFRKNLASQIQLELDETKKELNAYKASKIIEIDQKAKEVIMDVAKRVLPETIDLEKHADLVAKSLAKAKEEHFFDA